MLAVFAMGSVAAQGAQGANGTLTAAAYPAALTGTQIGAHKWEFTSLKQSAECEVAHFVGNLAAPGSSTVTLTPTYEKCIAFGLKATIDMEGCDYLIHFTNTLTPGGNYDGSLDIVCPPEKKIKITAGIVGNRCEVGIEPKTDLTTLEGVNKVGDVEIKAKITEITYIVTKDEGTCPLSLVGKTFHDGDYTGNVTLTGSSGLSISD